MGLIDTAFPTLARRIVAAIPEPVAAGPGQWTPRRAFLGLLGLVQSRRRESLARMLQRQHDLGLFPDFADAPSASGFSQGRHLLAVEDCRLAWEQARDWADERRGAEALSSPRWVAIDGSWLVTAGSRSCRRRWTTPSGGKLPQAVVVTAWDVRQRMPVGFCVLPGKVGERAGVDELLPHLRPGDITLMDRGFPCERLFDALLQRQVGFIARMTTGASAWAETSAFLASGEDEAVLPVEVSAADGSRRRVPLRFILRRFPRGRPKLGQSRDTMVLVTTLLDTETHPAETILNRYQERWAVETAYREMKITFAIEHFHSPDADRIVQELYALMTWLCLAAGMEAQVHTLLIAKRGPIDPANPIRWMINRTSLYEFTDQAFWALCTPGGWKAHEKIFLAHCEHLVRYAQRRRPGRSSPRARLAPFGHFNGG